MCLVVIARPAAPCRYALAIAANRDEAHYRPTEALHWWPDLPGVAGGRDGLAGGTWLAMRRDGRFAALLNAPGPAPAAARSRGELVTRFVADDAFDAGCMQAVAQRYAGFHCLAGDLDRTHHVGPERRHQQAMEAALVACGNAGCARPGPRVERVRDALPAALAETDPVAAVFAILADATPPDRGRDDGRGDSRPVFIHGTDYGTRSSSVILLDRSGRCGFHERRFDAAGAVIGERSLGWHRAGAA